MGTATLVFNVDQDKSCQRTVVMEVDGRLLASPVVSRLIKRTGVTTTANSASRVNA